MAMRESSPVRASDIRTSLVDGHLVIGALLTAIEAEAGTLARSRAPDPGRLVALGHTLARELSDHLHLEEAALAPLLTELDRSGEGRARGVIFQHRELAERLRVILGRGDSASVSELCQEMSSIARALKGILDAQHEQLNDPVFER